MDLVIMAAGLGSRFGGLKQLQPIDNKGHFIIDYSIFDAVKAGFDRIVIIIKKENFEDFKSTIGNRISPFVQVEYVFQDVNSFVPQDINVQFRTKPWGTAHAILCAKDKIKTDFAIINADDFYGRESFKTIYDFLNSNKKSTNAMVAYKTINTISNNGAVKRGICKIENGKLKGLNESAIRKENNLLYAKSLSQEEDEHCIDENSLVSMNLFGLKKEVLDYLKDGFDKFLNNKSNLESKEYFIPSILTELIDKNIFDMDVLSTNEKWFGLTYKEDYKEVFDGIERLRVQGVYPELLWKI